MNSRQVGILGEKIAEKFLRNKDYRILDKNYAPKFLSGPQRGEIDIIAKKGDIISFIEVKTLSQNGRGHTSAILPEDKVNFQKQRKIIRAAESWLMEKKVPLNSKWQLDVISIRIDSVHKKARIKHFENISF